MIPTSGKPRIRRIRPSDVDYGTNVGRAYPWICEYYDGHRTSLAFQTHRQAINFGDGISARIRNRDES